MRSRLTKAALTPTPAAAQKYDENVIVQTGKIFKK